jgi:glyoxylase-like metal-dependent hydrolase (beta-lactamase superfamily II)
MDSIAFFQRPYPSANSVLLLGRRTVLVDTGFGSDADALEAWLRGQGAGAESLSLVVNTHHHSDHVGGNHRLQSRHGVTIAAHASEAEAVNRRSPDACAADWLAQPIEPYWVARVLADGDRIGVGRKDWVVVATPGHTRGHLSLYSREDRALVLGDVVHAGDVAWLNPHLEGADSLSRLAESIERLSRLDVAVAYPGHGPPIRDFPAEAARGLERLRRWQESPEAAAWHACKRIFAHSLILYDGLAEDEVAPYLVATPWFRDFARHSFGSEPEDFAPRLVAEMLRAGAAKWEMGRLMPTAAYRAPPAGWCMAPDRPAYWPPAPNGLPQRI